jgi:hypothetical protein
MKYLFSIVILSAFVFSIGSTAPATLSSHSAPEVKLIKSIMCKDCDGKFSGVGNSCTAGAGSCVANPCPECNQ